MNKQSYDRPRRRRRRMDKFDIDEISGVDNPAQERATAVLTKAQTEEMSVDDLLKDDGFDGDDFSDTVIKRGGDLVDLASGTEEGHAHGISLHEGGNGLAVMVAYAAGPEGENHDHQVVESNGVYSMTENHGHTHAIDQDVMRQALMERLAKDDGEDAAPDLSILNGVIESAEIEKQGPSREVRERLARTGAALPDGSFPIRNGRDLRNAIQAFGRANREDRRRVATHIRRRARALGMTDQLPEEGVLADLLKQQDDDDGGQSQNAQETHMEDDDLNKARERADALEAENAYLAGVVALSPVHKAHFDTLDAAGQKAFVKSDDTERDALVAAAEIARADADPVVYKADDGTEFRKSDDPRMVQIAKRADESERSLAKERARLVDMDLTKRAEDFHFLKGDTDTRKALLSAVDGITDETVRAQVVETLKAANQTASPLFQTIGSAAGPAVEKSLGGNSRADAEAKLEEMVQDRLAKNGGDYYEVYGQVSDENPELKKQAIG